jgi:hypothetical protein
MVLTYCKTQFKTQRRKEEGRKECSKQDYETNRVVLHMRNKCITCHVPEGCMHGAIAAAAASIAAVVAAAATHEHHHRMNTTTLKKLQKLADQCCKELQQQSKANMGGGGKFKKRFLKLW